MASLLSEVTSTEVDLVRLDLDNPLLGGEVARTGRYLYGRRSEALNHPANDSTVVSSDARGSSTAERGSNIVNLRVANGD